jgi:crotonobetainyl-CoA:carnitine CoA-transferase CaiB-like acyl-CoA transferase
MDTSQKSLLEGYRALDLTQGGCLICGKTLADLGVEVIKIERPGGDPTRNIGPFYKDRTDPETSLFWMAYNANKKSITLNIDTTEGQELFRRLVKSVDFIIESFPPGHMDKLGLGYDRLSEINSRLIVTSITSFGQTGPKAPHKGSELTAWASGGELYLTGEPDYPPHWVSFPQASLHGGAEGAAATMIAHWHREMTGQGQHIDVSIQESVLGLTECLLPMWELAKVRLSRCGCAYLTAKGVRLSIGHRCKDGYVVVYILGGDVTMIDSCKKLIAWMDEEGMAPDWLKEMDWATEYDASKLTQEKVDRVEGAIRTFLMTKTRQELFDEALTRRFWNSPSSMIPSPTVVPLFSQAKPLVGLGVVRRQSVSTIERFTRIIWDYQERTYPC